MSINVQFLIDDWEQIRIITPPLSTPLLGRNPKLFEEVAELSRLSRRKEVWEVFICLMGYSQKARKNPNDVIRDISIKHIEKDLSKWNEEPFLSYCRTFKTVPRGAFLEAIRGLAKEVSFVTTSVTLERFQECKRLHDNKIADLMKCLAEED